MKFKDRLIGILQLFVCVAIPGTIYSSFKFSGHPLGGLETLVLYAPFVCFYLRAEIKRKRRRSSQEPKDNSIPITPEMLAASASENEPETNDTASAFDDELEPEDTMTREERLNQIKICRERAVSDYAQGNMSAKEFTDICALLKHMELEADIPVPEADKSGQQSSAKETYLIENDDGFLVRVPASKLDAWEKADHKAPLTPEEEQFIEKLLDSIYGPNANENEPPEVMSEINGLPNQPEVPPLYRQDRAEEKPIGYIPHSGHISHSGHAPIPWWRSGQAMARFALGLIAVVLIVAIIYAVVESFYGPAAAPAASPDLSPTPSESLSMPSESLSIQERLDRMKQDGEKVSKPLPIPISGKIFYENPYFNKRIAPLTIDASGEPRSTHFYVKLRFSQARTPILTFFIRGGTKKTIDIPLGTYEILYASGTEWYGTDLLFGPNTNYYLADEVFKFYEEDDYVNGWTITLSKQYNGNLDIDPISADEFFDN